MRSHFQLISCISIAAISIFSLSAQAPAEKKNSSDIFQSEFRIKNLSVNSVYSDFGFFPFGNNSFFFSSNRLNEQNGNEKQMYNWNNLPFLDVYRVKKSGDTSYAAPEVVPGGPETRYNEGPVFYDEARSTFYITRNNFNKKKYQQNRNGKNRLRIYIANIDGSSFQSEQEFNFNNDEYSVGHATVSGDGKRMIFSSDMPGGFGGVDLYVSEFNGESWGQPRNLGNTINTAGNEMFPFLSADEKLYFSSNGHGGQTGLDIYSAELSAGQYSNLKKLNAPFNSEMDDFSFFIYPGNKSGYFSSNRAGGKGDDDIYSFELDLPVIQGKVKDAKTGSPLQLVKIKILDDDLNYVEKFTDSLGEFRYEARWKNAYTIEASREGYSSEIQSVSTESRTGNRNLLYSLNKEEYGIEGQVLNKDNNKPVAEATVILVLLATGEEKQLVTDAEGKYRFSLKKNTDYNIKVEKTKYVTSYTPVTTKNMNIGVMKKNILLDELVVGKSIEIKNVYYDLGKWNIRPDAQVELDKMVVLMNENPTMVIELSSHTDSRGKDGSNLTLSEKRAKEVAAYLVSKGIAGSRVTGKGYGEKKLLNKCGNGVKCSEEEHQVNRRTEFKILKM